MAGRVWDVSGPATDVMTEKYRRCQILSQRRTSSPFCVAGMLTDHVSL